MYNTSNPYQAPKTPVSTVEEVQVAYGNAFHRAILARMGASCAFVEDIMHQFNIKRKQIANLMGISPKTLERHLKSNKPFEGLQSDRLFELANLHLHGLQVFNSKEKFLKWLNATSPALGNTAPIEWLDTHQGIDAVSNELGRIEHGIFA